MATQPPQPPEQRAAELIEKLPSSSVISKTGTALLGTGAVAAAISQELYVMNEEVVILAATAILFVYLGKVG